MFTGTMFGLLVTGTMSGLLFSIALLRPRSRSWRILAVVESTIRLSSVPPAMIVLYPLPTGLAGAATEVDRLGWRSLATALAAFARLALMLGVNLSALAPAGLGCAFAAAICRVLSLLGTRAYLNGTDARMTTWYSMVPSTVVFIAAAAAVGGWNPPQSGAGWLAFLGVSASSTLSTLLVYLSTNRTGPFRTALIMNLEPLVTTVLSVLLLGEVLTPLQALGAGVMIAALCGFQFVRGR